MFTLYLGFFCASLSTNNNIIIIFGLHSSCCNLFENIIRFYVWFTFTFVGQLSNTIKHNIMKLHEIIETNEDHTTSIEVGQLAVYKKSLLKYYSDLFPSEPMLMVTDVMNACQYAKIVPSGEFNEAICAYLDVNYIETDMEDENFDEDLFSQYETINFNSIQLSKF